MRKVPQTLIFLSFLFIILMQYSSCTRDTEDLRTLLRDSEALLENDPEAAYGMLDSLDINTIRPRSLRAEAALLYTKAQYQSYQEIRSDSVIGLAVSYYQGKDRQRSLWSESLMYKGALNYELGNLETAIESYKEAAGVLEPYAETREDYVTLGLIYTRMAESLSGNFMDFRQTVDNHLTALKYFREAGDTARQLNLLLNVGRDYYRNDKDSTLFYLRQAVDLAEDCADYETLYNSLFYIYNVYMVRGEYGYILEDYETRCKAGMPDDYKFHILPVLTETYIALGDTRSALDCYRSYMEFPSFCRDSIDELSLNVEISLMQKDYEKAYYALYAQQDYLVRSLDQAIKDQGLALTRRYDYRKALYEKALVQKDNRNMVYAIVILSFVVLSILYAVFHNIRKYRQYSRIKEQQIEELQREMQDMRIVRTTDEGQMSLIHSHCHDLSEMLELSYMYEGSPQVFLKKFKEKVKSRDAGSGLVKDIREMVNIVNGDIFDRIKESRPELKQSDLDFMALIYAGFSASAICAFYSYTNVSSVYNRKARLEKRLGVSSLSEYFKEISSVS